MNKKIEFVRNALEEMTTNELVLQLLASGMVHGISTVVRPPARDPCPF